MSDNLIKSKLRVADHGEVFTSQREVNAMLDLVQQETERIDSKFLEPACGNGNFLAEILKRKLARVESKYRKSQLQFERYAVIAVASIYGVDIMEDNAVECRQRLFDIFNTQYTRLFGELCSNEYRNSIRFILNRNILWGDALDFKNPKTKEYIIFSEWSIVTKSIIKRRDFLFKELVPNKKLDLFASDIHSQETGEPAFIPVPIKDHPPINIYSLGKC